MSLMPSRTKYRKMQKGTCKGNPTRGTTIAFGEYGLKSLERGWISNKEIEAVRVVITRHLKRKGKLWMRIFPWKPLTKKPLETRMGKGKGDVESWVSVVKPGLILVEVGGIPEQMAKEALRLAAAKLSVKTMFVSRHMRG